MKTQKRVSSQESEHKLLKQRDSALSGTLQLCWFCVSLYQLPDIICQGL